MKSRMLMFCLLLAAGASLSAGAQTTIAPNTKITVKLLAPLSTRTNHNGDKITAEVIAPGAFRGDMATGVVKKVKNSGKIHGKSVLNFNFNELYIHGQAVPVDSTIDSLTNSQGKENVDEEGQVIKPKSNLRQLALATALGAGLGALMGGAKGATIGAGVGAAASLVLIEMATKAPSIDFGAGSEFVLSVRQLGPGRPVMNPQGGTQPEPSNAQAYPAQPNPDGNNAANGQQGNTQNYPANPNQNLPYPDSGGQAQTAQ